MNQPTIHQHERLILTEGDKISPVWIKLMAYWECRLQALRIQNDGVKHETDTGLLRGRIAELKTFISLNNIQPGLEDLKD